MGLQGLRGGRGEDERAGRVEGSRVGQLHGRLGAAHQLGVERRQGALDARVQAVEPRRAVGEVPGDGEQDAHHHDRPRQGVHHSSPVRDSPRRSLVHRVSPLMSARTRPAPWVTVS